MRFRLSVWLIDDDLLPGMMWMCSDRVVHNMRRNPGRWRVSLELSKAQVLNLEDETMNQYV